MIDLVKRVVAKTHSEKMIEHSDAAFLEDPMHFIFETYYPKKLLSRKLPTMMFSVFIVSYLGFFASYGYYEILYKRNTEFMLRYIPSIFYLSMMIGTHIVFIAVSGRILEYKDIIKVYGISLRLSNRKTSSQILKESTRIKTVCMYLRIYIATAVCSFFPALGDEKQWQVPMYFQDKYFNAPCQIFGNILITTIYFITGYVYVVPPLAFYYVSCHIKFRYDILNQFVEKLLEKGEPDDEEFQRRIFENLRNCVKIHVQNKRLENRILGLTSWFIIALCLVSIMSFACLSFFILTKISPKSNFRVLSSIGINIVTLLIICMYSEKLRDVSLKVFHNGTNCPWWNWNKQNRKIFLIFLINSSKGIQISGHNIIDVNYALTLKILKTAYAILNIFITLNRDY